MTGSASFVLDGVCESGGNSCLVLVRGQGGDIADMARGPDSRLRGGGGAGIFGGLVQSPSEKTEGIPPVSLVFRQDSNPTDTQAKGHLREFFAKPPKIRKISVHARKPLHWVNREG